MFAPLVTIATEPPWAEVALKVEMMKVSLRNSVSFTVAFTALVTTGPESTVGLPTASWVFTMAEYTSSPASGETLAEPGTRVVFAGVASV